MITSVNYNTCNLQAYQHKGNNKQRFGAIRAAYVVKGREKIVNSAWNSTPVGGEEVDKYISHKIQELADKFQNSFYVKTDLFGKEHLGELGRYAKGRGRAIAIADLEDDFKDLTYKKVKGIIKTAKEFAKMTRNEKDFMASSFSGDTADFVRQNGGTFNTIRLEVERNIKNNTSRLIDIET